MFYQLYLNAVDLLVTWNLKDSSFYLWNYFCVQQPGRPRKDAGKEESKDALHQLTKPGGVSKAKTNPNVIVVPIQISKEMIAAKQSGGAGKSATKAAETSSSDSEKEKITKGKTAGKASEAKDTDSPSKDKVKDDDATPSTSKGSAKKPAAKTETKSAEQSPTMLPTRRSKRESNLSVKLAEWGLVPASGKTCFDLVKSSKSPWFLMFFL